MRLLSLMTALVVVLWIGFALWLTPVGGVAEAPVCPIGPFPESARDEVLGAATAAGLEPASNSTTVETLRRSEGAPLPTERRIEVSVTTTGEDFRKRVGGIAVRVEHEGVAMARGVSDRSGRAALSFEAPASSAGGESLKLDLVVDSPGYQSRMTALSAKVPELGGVQRLSGTARAVPGGSIRFRVVDLSGRSFATSAVRAYDAEGQWIQALSSQKFFGLMHFDAERFPRVRFLQATPGESWSALTPVDPERIDPHATFEIRLRSWNSVAGRLVDPLGRAVPGWRVTLTPAGAEWDDLQRLEAFGGASEAKTTSDANGFFSVPRVGDGEFELSASWGRESEVFDGGLIRPPNVALEMVVARRQIEVNLLDWDGSSLAFESAQRFAGLDDLDQDGPPIVTILPIASGANATGHSSRARSGPAVLPGVGPPRFLLAEPGAYRVVAAHPKWGVAIAEALVTPQNSMQSIELQFERRHAPARLDLQVDEDPAAPSTAPTVVTISDSGSGEMVALEVIYVGRPASVAVPAGSLSVRAKKGLFATGATAEEVVELGPGEVRSLVLHLRADTGTAGGSASSEARNQ
ncbi:carboxypeptidase-like regulatory domain-containing protein [Engelhardtia mirabilis]|uniref:Uncharacterized protein n=1 Tax=Engelhardtia mirabilis TaxID=2528011 RepID=A0A518BI17_9BACT|nr:hypothetical protein Pla133_17050 [Planctomycetes bacterium Pla133]QDV00955.1 hypothetical protein Pla86_17040 [Planctomycetes bacterium Pla86]